MNTRFDLDDKEWALIEPLLPKGLRGARRVDDRRILNGIFNILRTGSPWRDLPERYGSYTTCYNRYNRWSKRGVFKDIFDKLARQSKDSLHMIDSTIVRAHHAAAGAKGGSLAQGIGRSRGGRTTKLHALVDGLGRPLAFTLTSGDCHDAPVLPTLLTQPTAPLALCADKAYDSQHFRQAIKDDGAVPVIPYRSNAKNPKLYDKPLYRERNIIERFFCRFKDMRRLSQRFDKLARNYLAAVHLFAIRRWLSY